MTDTRIPLSRRQHEVLQLIADGHDSYAIGRILAISRDTVKGYTKQLYRMLGVDNRAQAVAVGFREGLIK